MTNHLSDWEIEESIIESPDDRARQHLSTCALCMFDKKRLEEALFLYREVAVTVTGHTPQTRANRASAARRFTGWSADLWQWSVALLLLALTVSTPIYMRHRQEQHQAVEITRDNLLLQQVDEEVSDSVPQPMESLTHLVVAGEQSNAVPRSEE